MWANSAAESLFGGPGTAPARAANARTAPTTRRRPRDTAEPVASTPPPGASVGATVAEAGSRSRPGIFRRAWARCLAVFGRRVSEARG
jgi:hypothetical protein